MSYFNKLFFKTFLFLALAFSFSNSVYAKTYTYWESWVTSGYCATTSSAICSHAASLYNKPLSQCDVTSGSDRQYATAMTRRYVCTSYDQVTGNCTGGSYSGDLIQVHTGASGASRGIVCADDEKLELIGCEAKCVADPCKNLKDQQFSGASACGSFACNSGTLQNGSCDGRVVLTGAASQVTDTNKCIGTLVSNDLTKAYYRKEDNGKTSGVAYCSATYKYLGVSDTSEPTPLDLAFLALYQAVPLPDNGVCPADKPLPVNIGGVDACIDNKLPDDNPCPVEGEKPNSNGVCVGPDDPTYPKDNDPTKPDPKTSCPTGKIRNNSGECVPYADAGKCPVGTVRDNTGSTCIPDPKANSCGQGLVKNKLTGSCDKDPRGTGCNDNSIPDKNGICGDGSASCASGKKRDANGYCVPNSTPDQTGCKDGSTPNSQGKCSDGSASCPVGKVRGQDGKCVLDTTESNSSGTASSDCDVAPDCGGDPLQCASLEQIWRTGCEQIKAMSEISQEDADKMGAAATQSKADYQTAQQGIDTQAQGFFSDFETKASSVSSSTQCINDASLSVMGKSLIIPFSQACDFFRFLRIILLFSAYMLSARILFSGVS